MTDTLEHYNKTADRYAQVNHTLASDQVDRDHFLKHLRSQGVIPTDRPMRLLDAGSGSGRDTLAFMEAGFEVDAFDGSEAMAAISSKLTGKPTQVMRFEELNLPTNHYDGIWAMASLLHVAREDLPQVIETLANALVPGGLLFASFKHGSKTRTVPEDGRRFTDLDESGVAQLLEGVTGLECVVTAHREPPAAQSYQAPWFSVIFKRSGPEPVAQSTAEPKRRTGPR